MQLHDTELFKRIQTHDEEALELLYDRYEKLLFSFCYRMTNNSFLAEEIVQDVFTKLWTKQRNFDETKGKFSSWLLTVTRNAALDKLRKKSVKTYELDERDALHEDPSSVETQVEWKEENEQLQTAMKTLSEEQRGIIELFYFKGMSQTSIAETCGIPLGTVKGRVRLALKHLRTELSSIKERGMQHEQ
ncbi:RNA polymerase sigma factor [Virgibacillus halodenitrificans]|jgi:RNA polymerase sigma factor (sigma-70 family)|uniref:Sigma-70 family RNA polymerase sigma factor n=1 Tax=Virgibacillus halodenitrificans TaxID=1482 RepID=A0ABR7VNY9_VIRHA|nr:sigma-70 family RNA polymerase sigma factor [Virgibacillus halodenitrificans]MBD1222543.1 sigma-70 family RNA polymerase sigma factor [Virgibacillus halodenitrificans]MCG1030005.1 sigma-70 family RNA polymerase sigma factor [Virgibacillus halodenitrificans]MCJ0932091.1 sigma-70 family RNA polymerase sigma factor [Virgibacillus halodenitrificans]MYL59232.1 sigma-70 family RNA polymerase sigma factor [Virgibacillus halodenitrificans]CDQ31747.1 Sigma-K factor [Virgibacillus halodenitrificans]